MAYAAPRTVRRRRRRSSRPAAAQPPATGRRPAARASRYGHRRRARRGPPMARPRRWPVKRRRVREAPRRCEAGRGRRRRAAPRGGGRHGCRRRRLLITSTRFRGPRSGSTARTRPSTRRYVDYKLPCGKHKLAFKRPDMQIDQTESINVKPGRELQAVATRWPPKTIDSPIGWPCRTESEASVRAAERRRRRARAVAREALDAAWRDFFARAREPPRAPGGAGLHARDLKEAFAPHGPGGRAVLEVGCGEGDLLASLPNAAPHGHRLSARRRSRAPRRRHPEISFEVGDVTARRGRRIGPAASGTWDAVICDRLVPQRAGRQGAAAGPQAPARRPAAAST